MPVEGLPVREVRFALARVGAGVEPAAFRELFSRAVFEFVGVWGNSWSVGFWWYGGEGTAPVLKGGTWPRLSSQRLWRWYWAYSGVVLIFWLGALGSIVRLLQ